MAIAMLKMQQGMGLIEECIKTATNSFPIGAEENLQKVINLITKLGEKLIETGSIANDSLGLIKDQTTALRNAMYLIPIGTALLVYGRRLQHGEGNETKNTPYLATQLIGTACLCLALRFVMKSYFSSQAFMRGLDQKVLQICSAST